jgi:hypothetical protein
MDKEFARPPGVPPGFVKQIEEAIAASKRSKAQPELGDTANEGKAADVPLPSALIQEHIEQRRSAGASETEITKELYWLFRVFQHRAKGGGVPEFPPMG